VTAKGTVAQRSLRRGTLDTGPMLIYLVIWGLVVLFRGISSGSFPPASVALEVCYAA